MMMLLMMQPRSQILSYYTPRDDGVFASCKMSFLFVCVHVPCSKMPESGSKSKRNVAFSVFFARRLAQVTRQLPGPVTRQAKYPSHTHKNCKASQKNIIVPLQNCIAVYHDSETP